MTSLALLIPLSILILIGAGVALFWAIDHGQFDDLESAGLVPLVDGDDVSAKDVDGAAKDEP
jgi:cbb3-type cytochrome oxidase maturation protein